MLQNIYIRIPGEYGTHKRQRAEFITDTWGMDDAWSALASNRCLVATSRLCILLSLHFLLCTGDRVQGLHAAA